MLISLSIYCWPCISKSQKYNLV